MSSLHSVSQNKARISPLLLKSYKLLHEDWFYSGERPYIYTAAIIPNIYVNINLWFKSSWNTMVGWPSERSISNSCPTPSVRRTGPHSCRPSVWPHHRHNQLQLNFTTNLDRMAHSHPPIETFLYNPNHPILMIALDYIFTSWKLELVSCFSLTSFNTMQI